MSFTALLMLGALGFYWIQFPKSQPVSATANSTAPSPSPDTMREALQVSDELTTKWLNALATEEWLFVSYKDETFLGDAGIDPENGWLLPTRSLWEIWYTLDEKGQQTTVVSQRTDLELGNVTQVIWRDGKLLRLPSGVSEDTKISGRAWEFYKPLQDHFCNTRILDFVAPDTDGITKAIESKWLTSKDGSKQWVVEMTVLYSSPVLDAFEGINAIGNQDVCYRDGESGALDYTEHFVITDKGEQILASRTFDYVAVRMKKPPFEILSLLDLLKTDWVQP